MKRMLEELKKLDEKAYDDICSSFRYAELQWPELWPEYIGEKPYIPDDANLDDECLLDFIQGSIQRAIERRGWAYQVSLTFQGTSFGKIITKNDDGTKRVNSDHLGDSAAYVLLSAYLSILRAQARRLFKEVNNR